MRDNIKFQVLNCKNVETAIKRAAKQEEEVQRGKIMNYNSHYNTAGLIRLSP